MFLNLSYIYNVLHLIAQYSLRPVVWYVIQIKQPYFELLPLLLAPPLPHAPPPPPPLLIPLGLTAFTFQSFQPQNNRPQSLERGSAALHTHTWSRAADTSETLCTHSCPGWDQSLVSSCCSLWTRWIPVHQLHSASGFCVKLELLCSCGLSREEEKSIQQWMLCPHSQDGNYSHWVSFFFWGL